MKSYVGYSTDEYIRYHATSGGVGTALIKYMFEKGIINTSISFDFDASTLRYNPKIIHSYSDYNCVGSIYQEIDLINFIKSHINEIKGTFACFALPCQTRAIRFILERSGHKVFIFGLTCSSQQTLEATKYLLKRININPTDIRNIRYRGNGWPSGIQIETRNNKKVFIPNNGSIWTQIFHSRLFIRSKCFVCQDTLNQYSDLTLADPWLKRFSSEKKGKSLIVCNTNEGEKILYTCSKFQNIELEVIDYREVINSQKETIIRKNCYKQLSVAKCYKTIIESKLYRKIILIPLFFSVHCKIKKYIERFLLYKMNRHTTQFN